MPLGDDEQNILDWLVTGSSARVRQRQPRLRRTPTRPPSTYAQVFLDRHPSIGTDRAEELAIEWVGAGFWDPADAARWLDAGTPAYMAATTAQLASLGVPPAVACRNVFTFGRKTDETWLDLVHRGRMTAEKVRDLAKDAGLLAATPPDPGAPDPGSAG